MAIIKGPARARGVAPRGDETSPIIYSEGALVRGSGSVSAAQQGACVVVRQGKSHHLVIRTDFALWTTKSLL
jgi:hypothetical protein